MALDTRHLEKWGGRPDGRLRVEGGWGGLWRELGVLQLALCPGRAISTLLQVGSALGDNL